MRIALVLIICLAIFALGVESNNGKRFPNRRQLGRVWRKLKRAYKRDRFLGAAWLRLAFHNCIGEKCDGCVDLTQEANKGLENAIAKIDEIANHPRVRRFMTRADIIPLAAKLSIDKGLSLHNMMCRWRSPCTMPGPYQSGIKIFWGRSDACPTGNSTVSSVPNGFPKVEMTRAQMMNFFKNDSGMTEEEVTVLMAGGHSLGGSEVQHTGYSGLFHGMGHGWAHKYFNTWILERLTFHNGGISFRTFNNIPNDPENKKWQFRLMNRKAPMGFMLNTEIATIYDIDINTVNGTQCKINDNFFKMNLPPNGLETDEQFAEAKAKYDSVDHEYCPKAPTYDYAVKLAQDKVMFMRDFAAVFHKMVNKGYPEGTLRELPHRYSVW